jgi:hypothetical protein
VKEAHKRHRHTRVETAMHTGEDIKQRHANTQDKHGNKQRETSICRKGGNRKIKQIIGRKSEETETKHNQRGKHRDTDIGTDRVTEKNVQSKTGRDAHAAVCVRDLSWRSTNYTACQPHEFYFVLPAHP